ncbi:MAG: sugar porter family MFS transporter [Prolixibacteraceae bacterium]|jgi:SP family xylose:H+ symportor-like MFS transporter|nr:sugar porter family MFS transporter [Prolixibacteraceae bacterium]
MKQENAFLSYVARITLVATLGGLIFGYDTAVVSGAVKGIREFFVIPLSLDVELAKEVIISYRITICVAVLIIGMAVGGMLVRLFGLKKGISVTAGLFAVVLAVLFWQFDNTFVVTADLTNAITGFAVSSALIGCIVGGSTAGFISLSLGRKKGLLLSALLFIISGCGAAFPEKMSIPGIQPLTSFIFYRIVGGVGIGLASMLSPMYIAEIAPANIRGKLVSWNQFANVLGILLVYFINWFIARQGDEQWNITMGWRWMFFSGIIPSLAFMILLLFIPETPRYFALKGKHDKALDVLRKTVGEQEAKTAMKDIMATLVGKSVPWLSFGGMVIIIGILFGAFQQLMGINVVLYYAPKIFQNMGTRLDVSLLQTVMVGTVFLIFTVIAILTVDKLGRKRLLIIGGIIMGFSMAAVGFTFYAENMGILALVFILIYIAGFAMSWGPVMWVMLSEIFPNSIRGAMSIAVATIWITNLMISWSFPVIDDNAWLIDKFHHGFAYWIYAIICFLAVLFVVKLVPETKGKTLEQIEKFWKTHPV